LLRASKLKLTLAGDAGDGMLGRVGASPRPSVTTRSVPRSSRHAPVVVQADDEVGHREHGVVPQPARHDARVLRRPRYSIGCWLWRTLPRMPDTTASGSFTRHHDRALLDVQFQVGADLLEVQQMFLRANGCDICAHCLHAFGQGLFGTALLQLKIFRRQLAEERPEPI
jgi:hypothetical protein